LEREKALKEVSLQKIKTVMRKAVPSAVSTVDEWDSNGDIQTSLREQEQK